MRQCSAIGLVEMGRPLPATNECNSGMTRLQHRGLQCFVTWGKNWGIRRISTLRRGRKRNDKDPGRPTHRVDLNASIQTICNCLVEGILLEDKLTQLKDIVNISSTC